MLKALTLAIFAAVATTSSGAAQDWSFSIGAGPRVYYGPPPVFYEPQVIYEAPPEVYYQEPPMVIAPAPRSRILHMEAPEDVLAQLSRGGYSDLGPIDRRGALYVLTAVDGKGDLVSLEVSIFSGEIERSRVLEARYAATPARTPAAPRPRRPAPVAVPAKPAAVPAPAPTRAAAPAVPRDIPTATADREASGAETAPSSTLRDRLHTPPTAPPEPSGGEPDPLVVY